MPKLRIELRECDPEKTKTNQRRSLGSRWPISVRDERNAQCGVAGAERDERRPIDAARSHRGGVKLRFQAAAWALTQRRDVSLPGAPSPRSTGRGAPRSGRVGESASRVPRCRCTVCSGRRSSSAGACPPPRREPTWRKSGSRPSAAFSLQVVRAAFRLPRTNSNRWIAASRSTSRSPSDAWASRARVRDARLNRLRRRSTAALTQHLLDFRDRRGPRTGTALLHFFGSSQAGHAVVDAPPAPRRRSRRCGPRARDERKTRAGWPRRRGHDLPHRLEVVGGSREAMCLAMAAR